MAKKHSPSTRKGIPLGKSGGKRSRPATKEEIYCLKIGRNEPCPCGKTVDKIFNTDNGEQIIPVRLKYKKCCLGKKLFFHPDVAKRLGIKTENTNELNQ